jgi:hypothetical protein
VDDQDLVLPSEFPDELRGRAGDRPADLDDDPVHVVYSALIRT